MSSCQISRLIFCMSVNFRKRNDFFKRGRLAFEAGQFEKAIHAFNKVIEWDPHDANAHTFRGLSHRKIRNFEAALKDLQEVVRIDPSHRVGYLNLGCVQRDAGKIDEALESLNKAEEGDSENPLVFQNRATAYILKINWEGGRSDCETALAIAPEGAAAYAILAHVHLGTGEQDLAEQTVARALELDPEEAEAYRVRGIIRCARDDLENGIADFIRAKEFNTNVQLDYLDNPEVLNKSMGGVLFIDEAYSLTSRGDEKDFGLEAIGTLIKGMEDKRSDLVLIVAGYPEKMRQFLQANPGIKSRFSKVIRFNDYSAGELMAIFEKMCREHAYELADNTKENALKAFEALKPEEVGFYGNGRGVRNYFELTITHQANRLGELKEINTAQLVEIRPEDLPKEDFWVHD